MPQKIDPRDFLYRKVNPTQWDAFGAKIEAFVDKYDDLSFRLASIVSPMQVMDFFASSPAAKKQYGENVTGKDLYDAGFRLAILPAHVITDAGFAFKLEKDDSEYNPANGHVNIIDGKNAPFTWQKNARILTEEEMQKGVLQLPDL